MTRLPLLLGLLAAAFVGCEPDAGLVAPPSEGRVEIVVPLPRAVLIGGDSARSVRATVTLQSATYRIDQTRTVDPSMTDTLVFRGLPADEYRIRIELDGVRGSGAQRDTLTFQGDTTATALGGQVRLGPSVRPARLPGLVIQEISYSGAKGSDFYYQDQFVELYNGADSTIYLDGMILGQVTKQLDAGGIVRAGPIQLTRAYRFPGAVGGRTQPIRPRQFITVASDGINHTSALHPNSPDLSTADYEVYAPQFSLGDVDGPPVNMVIVVNPKQDFVLNLNSGAVVLTTGVSLSGDLVPTSEVIDGVEYANSLTNIPTLNEALDKAYTGIGVTRYSGISVERKRPGFDFNHSALDFVLLNRPAPGRQHDAADLYTPRLVRR